MKAPKQIMKLEYSGTIQTVNIVHESLIEARKVAFDDPDYVALIRHRLALAEQYTQVCMDKLAAMQQQLNAWEAHHD